MIIGKWAENFIGITHKLPRFLWILMARAWNITWGAVSLPSYSLGRKFIANFPRRLTRVVQWLSIRTARRLSVFVARIQFMVLYAWMMALIFPVVLIKVVKKYG